MDLWHCTARLVDDRVIAAEATSIRTAVDRILTKCLPRGLVVFAVVDNHMHLLLHGPREEVGETMRRLELSFHHHLPIPRPFERARFRRVADRDHLWRAVPYILKQIDRHGVRTDPLWEGSALHDLLGLRVPGRALHRRLLRHLPRLREGTLLGWLDVGAELAAVWDEPVDGERLGLLADAAAAAFALPNLCAGGRAPAAIRAACQATGAKVNVAAIARALGVGRRTVFRARRAEVPAASIRAVRRQVWLRVALRRSRRAGPSPGAGVSDGRGDRLFLG